MSTPFRPSSENMHSAADPKQASTGQHRTGYARRLFSLVWVMFASTTAALLMTRYWEGSIPTRPSLIEWIFLVTCWSVGLTLRFFLYRQRQVLSSLNDMEGARAERQRQ